MVPWRKNVVLKEPLWNKSVYFFLPGYLKAQELGSFKGVYKGSIVGFYNKGALII